MIKFKIPRAIPVLKRVLYGNNLQYCVDLVLNRFMKRLLAGLGFCGSFVPCFGMKKFLHIGLMQSSKGSE